MGNKKSNIQAWVDVEALVPSLCKKQMQVVIMTQRRMTDQDTSKAYKKDPSQALALSSSHINNLRVNIKDMVVLFYN